MARQKKVPAAVEPVQAYLDGVAKSLVDRRGGQVGQVIAALEERQQQLGTPLEEDGDTSPRQLVAEALTYLHNHQSQMHYAEYRRQGLPLTSSYLESAVKQFNRRVKGTEKFWSEPGAEALLQLRADHLSDDTPLQHYWETRQDNETGQRRYRKAAWLQTVSYTLTAPRREERP